MYFIAWPPVNQFSLTEGLRCLKVENEMNMNLLSTDYSRDALHMINQVFCLESMKVAITNFCHRLSFTSCRAKSSCLTGTLEPSRHILCVGASGSLKAKEFLH